MIILDVYEVRVSPALNRSLAIWHFKCSNTIEINSENFLISTQDCCMYCLLSSKTSKQFQASQWSPITPATIWTTYTRARAPILRESKMFCSYLNWTSSTSTIQVLVIYTFISTISYLPIELNQSLTFSFSPPGIFITHGSQERWSTKSETPCWWRSWCQQQR